MSKKPRLSAVIVVNGQKLTVQKPTFGMELRRQTLLETAQQDPLIEGEGIESLVRDGFHRFTYPSLAACTTGEMPSEAECYDIIKEELDTWLRTAREINPDWFPAPGETEEEQEKKESTPAQESI